MHAHSSSSKVRHRLVIFLITCAVLWTQFFGLGHAINHGWTPTAVSSALIQENDQGGLGQLSLAIGVSDKSQPNSSITHNCFAWDSCSLTTAVFLTTQIQFASSLVFFLLPPIFLPNFSYKLPQYFLSRAPPQLLSR
ncbi:hypothetical protein [Polynucleobacter kasalickyi]|uniref:DUF2946 domain-containing protein n=1 Tax=Polynucleobacter kasalickyi TaxID=1938817 RepID=A0A1W2AWC2_9BURK|nr:hypothetical protein [Polynucleobacter kasalickyi]SMC64904.1 hypothetical protein SAMN06296008_110121 [Polynucleobacter kasalickyi]